MVDFCSHSKFDCQASPRAGRSFLPLSLDPFLVASCPLLILHFIPYFLLLNIHSLFFLFFIFCSHFSLLTSHTSLFVSHFSFHASHSHFSPSLFILTFCFLPFFSLLSHFSFSTFQFPTSHFLTSLSHFSVPLLSLTSHSFPISFLISNACSDETTHIAEDYM
jgi:hypothetical protein